MTAGCKYSTLIVDVSDVLVTWPPNLSPPIPLQVLKSCLDSKTWYDYECGLISKEDCLQLLGERFSLDVTSIDDAWHQVRGSLRPNREMVSLVAEIRVQSGSNLRILGAFNVSPLDYDFFRNRASDEWSICNVIYTSAQLGTRMPNLSFFQRVLADENIDPHSTIFMGRNVDDVVTARSFGIHGILLKDFDEVRRTLRSLTADPVKRGLDYLRIAAGNLVTETDTGITMMENFGQLLILEALGDRSLVSLDEPSRRWNFFQGKGILTYDHYPDDLDTTCLGLIVMKPSEEFVHSLIDEMLEYLNDDGIPLTYFDHNTHRIDPVVAVNVLHLFYSYGRGSELKGALEWVHGVLVNRAYTDGTRYYLAECFLYFTGRLLRASNDAHLHETLADVLKERLREHIGAPDDALALAMRIVTCASVGIQDEANMCRLLPLQNEDGGWEIGWMYKYGRSGIKIGSRGVTTAFAIRAIEVFNEL